MQYGQSETKIENPHSLKMSKCPDLTGSSMLSRLGVWGTSEDPEQGQGMETLKASEEFSTVIARFMLFPFLKIFPLFTPFFLHFSQLLK